MGRKLIVTALAMSAFLLGLAPSSNAGTDMVEPYRAPARTYNYAPPPPRPVAYVPPVRVGFAIGPGYGYYRPRFWWHGPRRFWGPRASWRFRHWR